MPSGRPTSPASSFTSMEPVGELTHPVRHRKTSHNGALNGNLCLLVVNPTVITSMVAFGR